MDASSFAENLKLAGIIISTSFGFIKIWRDFPNIVKRRSKEQETLEFISSFLAIDISQRNRLTVEHAFEIYFKRQLSFEEIRTLLNMQNPLTATKMYLKSNHHLMFDSAEQIFKYKKGVQTERERKFIKIFNLIGYSIFAIFGFSLFFFFGDLIEGRNPILFFPLILVMFIAWYAAYLFLDDGVSIDIAGRFFKEAAKEKT